MNRRHFVSALSGAALAPAALPTFVPDALRRLSDAALVAADRGAPPAPPTGAPDAHAERLASDEDFWEPIQRAFDVNRQLVNLNNGGVSPSPSHVLESMVRDLRFSNELPVQHMWQVLEPKVETAREVLAREFGCDAEEVAITRNASESMETLILGLDLRRGDEVIVTNQNYPRMLTTWGQRARRDGIVVREVSFPVPPPTQQVIVDAIAAAITPRTRAIEVPHITNLSGHILPIREIVQLARPRGIPVLVDGAHAFAHFPFTRDELDCDYYGTSLHKWLYAPIGTGFLYVRREKISGMWPLMAAPPEMDANIRKYEEIGTHPAANHNAIPLAMAFHRGIGAARKVARLRYLRDRWATRAMAESGGRVRLLTALDSPFTGGIGLVAVEGVTPNALVDWFGRRHRTVVTPINHPEFAGVRVTPNVYTTLDEVDRFADGLVQAARHGVG
jgi:selenocysteine lyase/cysteine desulfurase